MAHAAQGRNLSPLPGASPDARRWPTRRSCSSTGPASAARRRWREQSAKRAATATSASTMMSRVRRAKSDPTGFVDDLPDRVDSRRGPARCRSSSRRSRDAVDRHRTPGRFILTGSANVLLLPKLADSLAGRMGILRLHPLCAVRAGRQAAALSRRPVRRTASGPEPTERLGAALAERIVGRGLPGGARAAHRARRCGLVSRLHRDAGAARRARLQPDRLARRAATAADSRSGPDGASPQREPISPGRFS